MLRFILYVEVIFINEISIVFSSVRDEEISHRGSASSHCFEILFTTVCHKRKDDVKILRMNFVAFIIFHLSKECIYMDVFLTFSSEKCH